MKLNEWPLVAEGGLMVMLDTAISPELQAEGIAREVVHQLQNMRRAANFDIADHIITYYQAEEPIRQVMRDCGRLLKGQNLPLELVNDSPPKGAYTEKYRFLDSEVLLAVRLVPSTSEGTSS